MNPAETDGTAIARYRKPAPLEDDGILLEEPVFGAAAGLKDTDQSLGVVEWVAKRIWHTLGLDYNRVDRQGPPEMGLNRGKGGWVEVSGTVCDGGLPLRNQVISCDIEQQDDPILVYLRSTDAFGEILIELDLVQGCARARSITAHRSLTGGQCHSSPMPEETSNRIVRQDDFAPVEKKGPVSLRIHAQGERVIVWADGREILRFSDPDPAGGKLGFGSTGTIRVKNIQQWELISEYEKKRREACLAEMHQFSMDLDAEYDNDVRKRNRVEKSRGGVTWTWKATGAKAAFRVAGSLVKAKLSSGLYGDEILVDGVFPEVEFKGKDGSVFGRDAKKKAEIEADDLSVRMTLPLKNSKGKTATAHVEIRFSVQTVWFWKIRIEGVNAAEIRAFVGMAEAFAISDKALENAPDAMHGLKALAGKSVLSHNYKVGLYAKCIAPDHTEMARRDRDLAFITTDSELRFATVVLPPQPLNMVGFKHRMVHFIRYPEGPNQQYRERPSFQEYPNNVELARFAGHGTGAMVWHHTWIGDNYRDREGFMVNEPEMARAMAETHRLGMKTIGYLGILPGRNSLLRIEDSCPLGGSETYGNYDKNWDLQDFTFYTVYGRYQEFLPWLTDHLCKEYDLDGYYLDGGSFGYLSRGPLTKPLNPGDAALTLDEIRFRVYYRVRKVLERNKSGYGLEPWSGLDYMLNGFYDCMMIGESFQEAPPEMYSEGHNALLTGCTVKMYGMRASSQNPYNIAMAAVNLSDIQVCSGNGSWGNLPDTTETWARVRPLWDILSGIDWDNLVEARPWYAQELISGNGFYAGNYTEPERVIIFLANKTEKAGTFTVRIKTSQLPKIDGKWKVRYCLNREGEIGELERGTLKIDLPALHDGPIGLELIPA